MLLPDLQHLVRHSSQLRDQMQVNFKDHQVSSGSRATHAADYIDVTLVKQAVALQYLVISGSLLTNRYQ